MLARRACANVRSAFPTKHTTVVRSRSFVAGAAMNGPARSPALADITPDNAMSFSEKQKDFRDGLVAAQKQKEQQESAYHSHCLSTPRTTASIALLVLGIPWCH